MTKRALLAATLLSATLSLPIGAAIGARVGGASPDDFALLVGVIDLVQRDFVHPVSSQQLTADALKGMLNRLDPHSDYMDEQEFRQLQSEIAGRFGGLGIQISQQDGVPMVISPIDDTPAASAGIQPGDRIVAVDGRSTRGVGLNDIVRILRGTPGTSVKLTLARGSDAPFDVTITRQIIEVPTVKARLEPDNIGYVRITQFGEETPKDLVRSLDDLKRQANGGLKGLVLDLRNDPGGLLTSAVAVTNAFIDGGTVVTVRGRGNEAQTLTAQQSGAVVPNTPMVVLINGASASASEIVAGALQDRRRATIMGTPSFGKGSVQTVMPIKDHGAVRLTTALYYTPAGRSIQGQGIAPDMVVEAPKDQQVAGAILQREGVLQGAIRNPGSLGGIGSPGQSAERVEDQTTFSPPIKFDLIGKPEDAQLKAALAHLQSSRAAPKQE
jgi:carboxyl-terminal processing protease